jgi:hypothetical protein
MKCSIASPVDDGASEWWRMFLQMAIFTNKSFFPGLSGHLINRNKAIFALAALQEF